MLYERWRVVARECAQETALRDLATGRSWTFAHLAAGTEPAGLSRARNHLACLNGTGPEFIFTLLCAWRRGQMVCPLETGATPPVLTQVPTPDICLLKTTSATTGAAKHVAFTNAQLAADADNIVATMGLRRDSPNLGVISLAHSYGFSNLVLPLLLHGIPLVLASSALPEALRQAAATGGNWTLPAVPALWRAWHEAGAIPANIRLAISAGAPLPLPLEQAVFERSGLKLHNFLGSTECGGIAYDASDTPRTDASFAGTAMRNVSLSCGKDGCLVVSGANVGDTYWPEPEARLGGGIFHTSDLVELRNDGVFLRGRASDLINVAGRKVAPESIEQALLTHHAVRECLVLGLPSKDAARGDEVAAVVATREEVTTEQLRQFLQTRLPDWQVPREWKLVKPLTGNARGKLSRAEWRQNWSTD
ncbi:MAG: long-chain fatty acid--CoA ligase [Gammaproteobacteria bacterium]|nr:long-chain fatty acid--CoA ligase [Gammaproteobacteria bacterium]